MLFIFSLLVFGASVYYLWAADRKLKQYNESFRQGRAISMILALLFGLIAFTRLLTVIPAGHVGVVDFFGSVSAKTLKSGINFRNPFARVIKFSIKTQQVFEVMAVPSKEGLTVNLDASVLYHLDPEKAAEVYKTVGVNYVEVILEPQFRSVCRGVTAGFEAKALYTSQRETLAQMISEDLKEMVSPRGIIVESTPLRKIELPRKVTDAIEDKLKAEQESQRMEFILTKEKQEAERKRIEARGISDFQNIVAQGISEPLLRWKGIEATEKLASSSNSKIVIIGSGKDGLPVILDTK
ncbi:prohibitin family protein [candidate division TA06 bacterium]|uniref:Prohibitin family protein n=1 Tax=candidate division TA06 bacterium TaxID=2250710 RepID=A0A933IAQ5_UNCT6|nr:prohibitin family protein [candidate division TA06 bacterium]